MAGGANRKIKLRLFNEDPHCYWCGVKTVVIDNTKIRKSPDNLATVDHLYSRYNPMRYVKQKPGEIRHVLACHKCNNSRAAQETKYLSIEELRKRGKGFSLNNGGKRIPKSQETLEDVLEILKKDGIVVDNIPPVCYSPHTNELGKTRTRVVPIKRRQRHLSQTIIRFGQRLLRRCLTLFRKRN